MSTTFNKMKVKIFRQLASLVSPNSLRAYLLRQSGLNIGRDVYIGNGFTFIDTLEIADQLEIQDRAQLAYNVTIVTNSTPGKSKIVEYNIGKIGKVTIKHDTWIGTGAIILPKVTIGEFSVVGAGAVVVKDVPPYTIVGGVPAREISKLEVRDENHY